MGLHQKSNREYFTISQGKIKKRVPEDTQGAIRSEVKNPSTGVTKIVHELIYNGFSGTLDNVLFKEDDYGKSWTICMSDNGYAVGLKITEKQRLCADFLQKLPNLKQGEHYSVVPYDFDGDKGSRVSGISIKKSNGEKIQKFYQHYDEAKKEFKNLHGFPAPEGDTSKFKSEDWKMYFEYNVMAKFLRPKSLEFIEKNFKSDFVAKDEPVSDIPNFEADEEDSSIPF